MKIRNLLLASYLLAASLVPLPASAAVVCENGICTQTFEFTGSAQSWQVPTGVNKISFKVYGASGGRGGAGGEIRGELTNLPSTLYLYVGGQGIEGNYAPGGFNGGGATTGNRGNEGSGGGASDIRFGSSLSDRVVVAGGGGGAGGYAGAPGGMGGGLVAEAGGSGQGGGGGGGTQTSGGSAGYSNGGSPATSGSFGVGGTGGYSWNAGGGGGGGGWYGGGGGGPDDNSCCSDGGGGGGGSSYARSDITLNVQHQSGVNTGNGRIEISYQQVVTIVSFTGEQDSSMLATFTLVMSANISGLTEEDFAVSQTCRLSELFIESATARINLLDCSHGEVTLTLKAAAVGPSPSSDVSVSIMFDKQAPEFSWGQNPAALAQKSLSTTYALSEGELTIEQLDTGSCTATIEDAHLMLEQCPEGLNTVSLLPNSLVDQWGNSGPAEEISFFFIVDLTAPDALWSEVEITQSENFRYSVLLTISESATFDPATVEFTSDALCQSGYEEGELSWFFYADCSYATGSWRLPAFSLLDEVGNEGPAEERIALFANAEPIAEPEPIETEPVAPEPVAPEPTQPAPPVAPESPQPAPTEAPATDSTSSPQQLPIIEPIEVPETEIPGEPPQQQESEFVLDNPPLIEAPPLIESEQSSQLAARQPVIETDLEVETEQPLSETEFTEQQFETEPILVETSDPESSPMPMLLVLLGAVLLIGFIGWRIIGR